MTESQPAPTKPAKPSEPDPVEIPADPSLLDESAVAPEGRVPLFTPDDVKAMFKAAMSPMVKAAIGTPEEPTPAGEPGPDDWFAASDAFAERAAAVTSAVSLASLTPNDSEFRAMAAEVDDMVQLPELIFSIVSRAVQVAAAAGLIPPAAAAVFAPNG